MYEHTPVVVVCSIYSNSPTTIATKYVDITGDSWKMTVLKCPSHFSSIEGIFDKNTQSTGAWTIILNVACEKCTESL